MQSTSSPLGRAPGSWLWVSPRTLGTFLNLRVDGELTVSFRDIDHVPHIDRWYDETTWDLPILHGERRSFDLTVPREVGYIHTYTHTGGMHSPPEEEIDLRFGRSLCDALGVPRGTRIGLHITPAGVERMDTYGIFNRKGDFTVQVPTPQFLRPDFEPGMLHAYRQL